METKPGKSNTPISVLVIRIGEEIYAVKAISIEEVVPIMSIRKIPDLPPYLEGFIDIRGVLYAVIDLNKQFGGESREFVLSNRIILIRHRGRNIGFIVDEILRIEEWLPDVCQAGILSDCMNEAFSGEVGQTETEDIQILDLCKILSEEQLSKIAVREGIQ